MDLRAPTGKKWLPAPTAMMAFRQPWPCQISTHRPWACRQATKKQWAPALTEMTAFRQQWLWQTGAQPRESTHACSTPTRLVRRGKRHQWKSPKKLNNACKCKVLCNTNREGSAPDRRNTSQKTAQRPLLRRTKKRIEKTGFVIVMQPLAPLLLPAPPPAPRTPSPPSAHHPSTPSLPSLSLPRYLSLSLSLSLPLLPPFPDPLRPPSHTQWLPLGPVPTATLIQLARTPPACSTRITPMADTKVMPICRQYSAGIPLQSDNYASMSQTAPN